MLNKPYPYLVAGIIFFALTWAFTGIFFDEEFHDANIFLKYRPTAQVVFYSPIGMDDMALGHMSDNQQQDQIAFDDFIVSHEYKQKGNRGSILAMVLIQLTLSFWVFAFYVSRQPGTISWWHLPAHFAMNFLITGIAIGTALAVTKKNALTSVMVITAILFLVNYFTVRLLTARQRVIV